MLYKITLILKLHFLSLNIFFFEKDLKGYYVKKLLSSVIFFPSTEGILLLQLIVCYIKLIFELFRAGIANVLHQEYIVMVATV